MMWFYWNFHDLISRKKPGNHGMIAEHQSLRAEFLWSTTTGRDWVKTCGQQCLTWSQIKVRDLKAIDTHAEWDSWGWGAVHMHTPDFILWVWATSESPCVSFSSGVQTSKVIFAVLWSLARSPALSDNTSWYFSDCVAWFLSRIFLLHNMKGQLCSSK